MKELDSQCAHFSLNFLKKEKSNAQLKECGPSFWMQLEEAEKLQKLSSVQKM